MGQISTITLTDAAATPVNHDFVPRKVVGDMATYVEKTDTRPMGWYTLELSHRLPANGSKVVRDRITLKVPVIENVDGVDKVVRTNVVDIEYRTTTETTLQERKDLVAYITDLHGEAAFADMVEDGNNIY
jgi:hypothetical protein